MCVNDDGMHYDHDRVHDHCHDPIGCDDDLAMAEWTNDDDAFYCATTNAIVAFVNVIVAATIVKHLSLISAHHNRDHHVHHSRRHVHV